LDVHVTEHVISSDGVSLHKNGTLLCDGEVIEFLSHHSHPGHASAGSIGNPVLYRAQGNLVLDELPLPSVDEGTMHGAKIQSTDGVAVARVAWVHVTTVDKMNGLGEGTTKELINQLRSWAGRQQGDVNSTSIQPAAGQYISLGHGILPGKNRHSVMLDDRPTNIPFSRAPGWRSDDVEPMLSSLNGTVAQCMTSVFPDMKRCSGLPQLPHFFFVPNPPGFFIELPMANSPIKV